MKITGFINKQNLGFRPLQKLFNPKPGIKKSDSIDHLLKEISTQEYYDKIICLIKNDLLLRYTPEAVENSIVNLEFHLYSKAGSEPTFKKERENFIVQQSTPKVKTNEILTDEKKQEVWKVETRIPKWFRNPHQINTRILITFMELLRDNNSVPVHKLEAACRSINTFQTNYSQMKIIAEKNHAKVFEESGGRITLWEPVKMFVKKEYEKYNRRRGKSYTT